MMMTMMTIIKHTGCDAQLASWGIFHGNVRAIFGDVWGYVVCSGEISWVLIFHRSISGQDFFYISDGMFGALLWWG